jgi:hypothetical protein
VEANSTGGQGSRRSVAPNDDNDDDDDYSEVKNERSYSSHPAVCLSALEKLNFIFTFLY